MGVHTAPNSQLLERYASLAFANSPLALALAQARALVAASFSNWKPLAVNALFPLH
jgi:hypothetical protein